MKRAMKIIFNCFDSSNERALLVNRDRKSVKFLLGLEPSMILFILCIYVRMFKQYSKH